MNAAVLAMPELVIRKQDGSSRVVPLDTDHIGLGRSSTNELCFAEDFGLSRQHLVFERHGDDWVVRDLGSKNGTLVNSERLVCPRTLIPGDRVIAGHLTIEYQIAGAPVALNQTVCFVDANTVQTAGAIVTDLNGALGTSKADEKERGADLSSKKAVDALIRAGQALSGHLPLGELFDMILQLSMDAVSASRGLLITIENDDLVLRAARGDQFEISVTVRDRVLKEKASILVVDAMIDADLRERRSIVEQRVRSIMAVPLQTSDRVIGLIYVDVTNILQPFTQEDLKLLTVMANVAAIRIEQARLVEVEQAERILERELAQAAEIQRKLLPSSEPVIPGIDVAACNIPCHTVGGDYYDFLTLPDGRIGFVVADVAGKGMPAALLMSSLQAFVHAISETTDSVCELVTRLNRNLSSRCPRNRFITLFACVLNPVTGELTYVNAGHNPPLLIRRDGTIQNLDGDGLVLGLFSAASYSEQTGRIDPGDALVLFSDGVTEACPPESEDEFGEHRLANVITSAPDRAANETIKTVMETLKSWTAGTGFADDVTLIVVRRPAVQSAAFQA